MSKSSFNALVEAKKQRDGSAETAEITQIGGESENESREKNAARKNAVSERLNPVKSESDLVQTTAVPRPGKRDTVRRSYRVDEPHDKAIKVMSKFMGKGTEEEIVLNIFAYFFENNADGEKALHMVEMLGQN